MQIVKFDFNQYLVKPDNILTLNNNRTIKLCDFGTACPVEENLLVEYL